MQPKHSLDLYSSADCRDKLLQKLGGFVMNTKDKSPNDLVKFEKKKTGSLRRVALCCF